MTKPKYQITNFYGTVILKDWMTTLDDRQVRRVTGFLSLVKDEDIAGFRTRGTEANCGIRAIGNQEQWTILGCQIRAVIAHSKEAKQSVEGALVVP